MTLLIEPIWNRVSGVIGVRASALAKPKLSTVAALGRGHAEGHAGQDEVAEVRFAIGADRLDRGGNVGSALRQRPPGELPPIAKAEAAAGECAPATTCKSPRCDRFDGRRGRFKRVSSDRLCRTGPGGRNAILTADADAAPSTE